MLGESFILNRKRLDNIQKSWLTYNVVLNADFNIGSINSSFLGLTHCHLFCDIENKLWLLVNNI